MDSDTLETSLFTQYCNAVIPGTNKVELSDDSMESVPTVYHNFVIGECSGRMGQKSKYNPGDAAQRDVLDSNDQQSAFKNQEHRIERGKSIASGEAIQDNTNLKTSCLHKGKSPMIFERRKEGKVGHNLNEKLTDNENKGSSTADSWRVFKA